MILRQGEQMPSMEVSKGIKHHCIHALMHMDSQILHVINICTFDYYWRQMELLMRTDMYSLNLLNLLYTHASITKWLFPVCLSTAVIPISFNCKISTWSNQHCATTDEAETTTKNEAWARCELLKELLNSFKYNEV